MLWVPCSSFRSSGPPSPPPRHGVSLLGALRLLRPGCVEGCVASAMLGILLGYEWTGDY
jgi:hypothetical protein